MERNNKLGLFALNAWWRTFLGLPRSLPGPGHQRYLDIIQAFDTSPNFGDLLIVLIRKPSSYDRRQPTLLFGKFKNIYDIIETILIIQYSEAIHMEYLFLCETIHTIVTLVIQHMYLHETVSTSPMEYLFLCRTIHTIHLINTLVSVLMKLSWQSRNMKQSISWSTLFPSLMEYLFLCETIHTIITDNAVYVPMSRHYLHH